MRVIDSTEVGASSSAQATRTAPRATPSGSPDWRRAVEPYVGPDTRRAALQAATTLGLLALSFLTIHVALHSSIPFAEVLAFLLVLPTGGLLVRTFILMHDCAHGSFSESRRINDAVGFVTGVLTLTPFSQWRRDHALHHASSGDLARRGHGDVPTLTVREYLAKTPRQRLGYRTIRHPALLLFGGPFHLVIGQRWRGRSTATGSAQISSVLATNIGIALVMIIGFMAVGWQTMLVGYILPFYFAAMAGIWLFYVQHQFEDAYWTAHDEWNYVDAALLGSSHLQLSPVLRWFTGSIGLHHVHHLAPRIPNYRLQRCHDENEMFHCAPVITLRSGMAALRLALWDEDGNRLVRFADVADSSTTVSTPRGQ
jgi:omega-6 fatty acid desaturase (delta-12 desaturase)